MATYSALPATLNLVATVGNDFSLALTVTESGSPWVATGATLATDIIDSSGTVVATDFTTAASTGTVSLSLTDANTTTLGVGVYSYRLSVTKSSLTRDWIAGTLSIVEAGQGGTSTSSASLSISNSAVTLGITSLVAPDPTVLPISNGTDDTTAIQAILTAYAGKVIKGRPGESYIISDPLVISSGTTLDMTGCTITLAASSNCNMLQNYAVSNPVRSTSADASVTSGNLTITSATGAFVAGDVGRALAVEHTSANSGSSAYGTIATVNGSTSVTITGFAILTQSGGVLRVYDRDSNITVRGGTWARGSNTGSGTDLHTLRFRRCDGLLVENVTVTTSAGKYAINLADVTEAVVRGCSFDVASDGVHVTGPATNVSVSDITGTMGDDAVAFCSSEGTTYLTYRDTLGDITGANISQVDATCSTYVLKLATGDGTAMSLVRADRIRNRLGPALYVADDTGTISIRDVAISNMAGWWQTGTTGAIDAMKFSDCIFVPDANSRSWCIVSCDVTHLALDRVTTYNPSSYTACHLVTLNGTCTVQRLVLDGCVSRSGGSAYMVRPADGTVVLTDLILNDCVHDGISSSGGFLACGATGATVTRVRMSNCVAVNNSWFADVWQTTEFSMANCRSASGSFFLRATGNATVYGAGIVSVSGPSITAGGALRSKTLDFNVDTGLTGFAVTNGDLAYNTNAARGNGVGPCVANGTVWKNLYTGAVGP